MYIFDCSAKVKNILIKLQKILQIFCQIYIILFFNFRYISPRLDFPKAVVEKQYAFLKIKPGKTTVPINALEPTAISFLKNTPQAINLTVLRPYPSEIHHLLSLAAVIEMYSAPLYSANRPDQLARNQKRNHKTH